MQLHITSHTKVELVCHAVLRMVFSGALEAGQRIVEAKLAKDLGVSQATVNAALQDLHNQGIVTKLLNRSTNVSRYTEREIDHLFSVRLILEPAACAAASRELTAAGVEALEEQVEQMRRGARTGDLQRFCLADYSFHQEIYRLSCNPFLIQACQAIAAAPFAYILCGGASALPTDYVALAEDHQRVIRALRKGPDAAERVVRKCIESWRQHSDHALEAAKEPKVKYAAR